MGGFLFKTLGGVIGGALGGPGGAAIGAAGGGIAGGSGGGVGFRGFNPSGNRGAAAGTTIIVQAIDAKSVKQLLDDQSIANLFTNTVLNTVSNV